MKLNKKTACLSLFAIPAVLSLSALVLAQNNSAPANTPLPVQTATVTPTPTPTPKPKVTRVYRLDGKDLDAPTAAGIGNIIIVEVRNLKALDYDARCINPKDETERHDCIKQDIALFLDKRKIDGI